MAWLKHNLLSPKEKHSAIYIEKESEGAQGQLQKTVCHAPRKKHTVEGLSFRGCI